MKCREHERQVVLYIIPSLDILLMRLDECGASVHHHSFFISILSMISLVNLSLNALLIIEYH